MTHEAELLMAEALKRVKLGGGFCPLEIGAKVGLNKPQAETAARALSNAGVLVLGFDFAAHFSPAYRKANTPVNRDATAKKKTGKSGKSTSAKRAKSVAAAD